MKKVYYENAPSMHGNSQVAQGYKRAETIKTDSKLFIADAGKWREFDPGGFHRCDPYFEMEWGNVTTD